MAGKIDERIELHSAPGSPAEAISGDVVLRKVARRLIPFLFVLYVANILDRANVSFARFEMLSDLDLGEEVYGWAATFCFYLGYLLFEVPSNLILHRVGARRWISRIMVSWGIVSTCTMLVKDARTFYLVRILLGVAEAGFFPGIVLYLSYWFPARERARAVACFMMASPLAGAFGGIVSGNILRYTDRAMGLAGWQWLFLIEGVPSVLLGLVTWWYLTDRPKDADWLSPDERSWLADRMDREEKHSESRHGLNRLGTLADARVGLFILLYFTIALGSNGFGFYAPEILKRQFVGWKADGIGYLYLIPNLTTAAAMFLIGSHSDQTCERRWHLAACAFLAAIGWGLSATLESPWLVLFSLTLAQVGMISMIGPFWSFATSFLSGLGAVGGIALINTIANTGGALSSPLMSWLEKVSGSFATGQLVLAGTMLVGGGLALCIRDRPPEKSSEPRCGELSIGTE